MQSMELRYFTTNENFPFFIQHGMHDKDFFLHNHKDFTELVIVLEGSATHNVNDEKYHISCGDVFVIGGDTVHGYTDLKDFHIYNIMFKPEAINFSQYDITKSVGFHALFLVEPYFNKNHGFKNKLKLSPSDFLSIKALSDRILSEYCAEKEGRETIVNALFLSLVVELSRLYSDTDKHSDKSVKNDIINIAKTASYIETHFSHDITVSSLAALIHYSERHFARLFKETYGMTPVDYILSIRLKNACAMLSDTNLSISEIALQSGYSDNNYFSRVFKKKIGVTPSQFRSIKINDINGH